ncbi:MAG: DUF721 domain-containing protein [Candidatus Eisenbacteria bacterium]
MEHIGDALRGFLKSAHLDRRIAEYEPVLSWPRIVGPEVAAHSTALRLQRGVLWVAVSGSVWMQHLGFLKPQILEALRREFPNVRITDVRCVMGSVQQP